MTTDTPQLLDMHMDGRRLDCATDDGNVDLVVLRFMVDSK